MSFFLMAAKRAGGAAPSGGAPASIAITPSSSTRTMVQGGTNDTPFTLTRTSFTGTVTPAVSGLPSGVTGAFSPSTLTGATLATVLTLTATGGAGLVTNDAFTVTCSGSGVTDATANLTVTVAAAGSDPGPGANEPVGFSTVYAANPFDTMPPTSDAGDTYKFTRYEIVAGNRLEIRTDGDGGASDPNYMRHNYLAGDAGGQVNSTYRAGNNFSGASLESPKSQMYIRIRVRLSSNWSDNGNTGTKFFFISQFTENTQNNNHYIGLTDAGALTFGAGTQNNDAPGNNRYFPNTVGAFSKGVWHDLEILVIANTTVAGVSETADGILRIWVDGSLATEVTDVLWFRRNQTACWRGLYANPTFGGGANAVPADQYYDVDHWYTSLKA